MDTAAAQAFVASHRDTSSAALFGISDLCREFDLSQRALRFYKDKCLLSPRRVNGTRIYAEIAALETKRAQIDSMLEELRVINAACRQQLASRMPSAA